MREAVTTMNDNQKRIWKTMISSLDAYRSSRTGFYKMVGDLEGGLDAGEFRDKKLIRDFYDVWGDLEIARARRGRRKLLGLISVERQPSCVTDRASCCDAAPARVEAILRTLRR